MKVAFVCSGKAGNLKYLKNNRTLIEDTFRNQGWEVVSTPLSDISDLNKQLHEYTKNTIDKFIFYFTGHGDVSNQQQILKLQLDNSKISINEVLDSISEYINPKKQAIILDACYSGTLKGLNLNKNIEFLFSSQAKEPSYESDELEHSIFSYYFAEAIGQIEGKVSLNSISQYILWKSDKQEPLFLNISNNSILFSNNFINSKKLKKEKYTQRLHPLYLITLFLVIVIFIILPKYQSSQNSTLTNILLEDRDRDKKELKAKEEARAAAEKAKNISEQRRKNLIKIILETFDKDEVYKILTEEERIYASYGVLKSIIFLEKTIQLFKMNEKISKIKEQDKERERIYNATIQAKKQDILYQVELYEDTEKNIKSCEIEYPESQSQLLITCNNIIDYLDIDYTIDNCTLTLIAKNSTNFNAVKENLTLYTKLEKSISKIFHSNKSFIELFYFKSKYNEVYHNSRYKILDAYRNKLINRDIYRELLNDINRDRKAKKYIIVKAKAKENFTERQYSKPVFTDIYNYLIRTQTAN